MKNVFKKTIAFLMAATAMVSTASVFADFADMPEDETKPALENAVENGLLTGYEDGTLRPYDNITRAQMAAIITRAMGATATADISGFGDMNPAQWYYDAMAKAVAMDAFQGDGVNLNPEANITFQEAFAVLARVFDLQTIEEVDTIKVKLNILTEYPVYTSTALDTYTDKAQVSDWAVPTTLAILEGGYWVGKDNLLRPTEYINRVEFAVLMDNLVKTYIDEPGEYTENLVGNVLIRSNGVTIDNLVGETVDVIVGDGVTTGVVLGEGIDINRLVQRGGEVMAKGTYNQIRMIGHNCLLDVSQTKDVELQIFGKYADSKINVGIKDLG